MKKIIIYLIVLISLINVVNSIGYYNTFLKENFECNGACLEWVASSGSNLNWTTVKRQPAIAGDYSGYINATSQYKRVYPKKITDLTGQTKNITIMELVNISDFGNGEGLVPLRIASVGCNIAFRPYGTGGKCEIGNSLDTSNDFKDASGSIVQVETNKIYAIAMTFNGSFNDPKSEQNRCDGYIYDYPSMTLLGNASIRNAVFTSNNDVVYIYYGNATIDSICIYNGTIFNASILDYCQYKQPVFINTSPKNNNNLNTTFVNFSTEFLTYYTSSNLSLYIDGEYISSTNYTNGTHLNYTYLELSTGTHTYRYELLSSLYSESTEEITFYIDITFPSINTNLSEVHNSFTRSGANEIYFNFSDDFILSMANISINEKTYYFNNSMTIDSFNLTLNFNFSNFSIGDVGNITVFLADGHTANEIKNYVVEYPFLRKDKIKYRFTKEEGYNEGYIEINTESLFDEMYTEKEKDRYKFKYNPYLKKKEYVFELSSSFPIKIVDVPHTKYKKWIIADNHWIDWFSEDLKEIEIIKINDYSAKIFVKLNNEADEIKFESLGDINIIKKNYPFFVNISNEEHLYLNYTNGTETEFKTYQFSVPKGFFNYMTSFIYNGTSYSPNKIITEENLYTYVYNIYLPLGTNNLNNYTYNFSYSLNNGDYKGFYFGNTYTNKIYAYPCDNTSLGNYIFLNITYYDEKTLSKIKTNSTIIITNLKENTSSPYSRSYNLNYSNFYNNSICFYPNDTFNLDYTIYYKGEYYPQRVYTETSKVLSSTTSLLTLYLLYIYDGIYTRFRAVDIYSIPIISVIVYAYDSLTGLLLSQETTDNSGLVTFFLNPDKYYDIIFYKQGYTTGNLSVRPTTSDIYTYTMSSQLSYNDSIQTGITYTFSPTFQTLNFNQLYNFIFNLTSQYYTVTDFWFELWNTTDMLIRYQNTSKNQISIEYNTSNQTYIQGIATYQIENINYSVYQEWRVRDVFVGNRSISNFLTDLELLGSNLNTFTRNILAFIFIFFIVLALTIKYNTMREIEITLIIINILVLLFSLIGWFSINNTFLGKYAIFMLVFITSLIIFINRYRYGVG